MSGCVRSLAALAVVSLLAACGGGGGGAGDSGSSTSEALTLLQTASDTHPTTARVLADTLCSMPAAMAAKNSAQYKAIPDTKVSVTTDSEYPTEKCLTVSWLPAAHPVTIHGDPFHVNVTTGKYIVDKVGAEVVGTDGTITVPFTAHLELNPIGRAIYATFTGLTAPPASANTTATLFRDANGKLQLKAANN